MAKGVAGKGKYIFRAYNPICKALFLAEKAVLLRAFGRRENVHIEHVGSTSVPGLGGKNVLDIEVGTERPGLRRLEGVMTSAGYEFSPTGGQHHRRLFFFKRVRFRGSAINVHAHLVRFNGVDWKSKLAFRDYLVAHPSSRKKYASVKRRAARIAQGDKDVYMREKEAFINRLLRKALTRHRR